jgi:hypothetical protein
MARDCTYFPDFSTLRLGSALAVRYIAPMVKGIALAVVIATATACGSGSHSPNACAGSSISCDATSNGQHICGVDCWDGGVFPSNDFATACQQKSGTVGTTCNTSGAVGGCVTTQTSPSLVTTTSWFYFGTAQSIQQACQAGGGTFVSP